MNRVRVTFYDKPETLPFPETTNLSGSVKVTVIASQNEQSHSRGIGVYLTDKKGQAIPLPDHDLVLVDQKTGKDADRQGIENGRAYFPNVTSDRCRLEVREKEDKKTPGPPLDVGLM